MRSRAASVRSVVVVAMAGIFVAIALTTSMGASAASYTTASYSARLLTLVNEARQQHGEQPLALVPGTSEVATGWTEHLAAVQLLSHNPRLARELSTHGSHSWLAYGENVGMGSAQDPDGLFQAYMNSPEHRANILSNDYRYVGVSAVFTGSRAWNTFDFVDIYQTAPVQRLMHRRAHPAVTVRHAVDPPPVVTHSVAHAAAAVSTPPVRPTPRAARPAGPVVVHVKAVLHLPRVRPARIVAASLPSTSWSAAPVASVRPMPHGHRLSPVAIAFAVLTLTVASRRWLLAVGLRAS